MRRSIVLSITGIIVFLLSASCVVKSGNKYKDGEFAGISRSIYQQENFYGVTKIGVSDGKITDVDFSIIDMDNKVFFDEKYEERFKDIPEYMEQCRNEWKAINIYPDILLEKQKIDSLDAITAATWSFNMFESSLTEALKKAMR
jgi:major membrane immunogen (membrane-anchored lipoprotein)